MANGWDDEDLSDLSEITDSDDDENETSASKPALPPPAPSAPSLTRKTRPQAKPAPAKGKARGRPAKIAKPDLSQPVQSSYSVELLYKYIVSGKINLDPEYQRPIVWTDQKQEMLIDSIFNNYPILPLIFAVYIDEETGEKRRTCIDGKQRLTSIYRFLKGEIAHKNPKNGRRMFANQPSSKKTVKVHPQGWLDKFTEQQVSCLEYQGLEPEVEREIFQRVQNGVVLAPHHRLPAANGPNATLIRSIRDEIQQYSEVANYISLEKSKVFQAVARGAYLIFYDHTPSYLEPTPLRLEKWLNNKDTERKTTTISDTVKEAFRIVFRHMQDKEFRLALDKLSPWEFSFLVYITYLVRQKVTDGHLSEIFTTFRQRAGDLLETRVTKEVFKRVLKTVKELTGKDHIPSRSIANSAALTPFHPIYVGEEDADEQPEEQMVVPEKAPEVWEKQECKPTRAPNPKKRKQTIFSDDEDDIPLAAAPKQKMAKTEQSATRLRRKQLLPSPTVSPVIPPSVPKSCQPQLSHRAPGPATWARETTTSIRKATESTTAPSLPGPAALPQKDRLAGMRGAKKLATRGNEEDPLFFPSTSTSTWAPPPPPSSANSFCHLPTPNTAAGTPPPLPIPSSSATVSAANISSQQQHPLPRGKDGPAISKARLPSFSKVEQDKMRYSPPPMYPVKSFPMRAGAGGAPVRRANGGSTGSIASVESSSQPHSNMNGKMSLGQNSGPATGSQSDPHQVLQQQVTGTALSSAQSAAGRYWQPSGSGRIVS